MHGLALKAFSPKPVHHAIAQVLSAEEDKHLVLLMREHLPQVCVQEFLLGGVSFVPSRFVEYHYLLHDVLASCRSTFLILPDCELYGLGPILTYLASQALDRWRPSRREKHAL